MQFKNKALQYYYWIVLLKKTTTIKPSLSKGLIVVSRYRGNGLCEGWKNNRLNAIDSYVNLVIYLKAVGEN